MSKKRKLREAVVQEAHESAREESVDHLSRALSKFGHQSHPEASEAEETVTRRAFGLPS